MGRKALILERFDRPGDGTRRGVVSALTILGLPETFMPIGSYPEVLDQLRLHSSTPEGLGEQLFRRIACNIAISNTDDHLRNHAAFWDGHHLDLTPAYDLSPVRRPGEVAGQALAYGRKGERDSNLAKLVAHAHHYDLTAARAREVAREVVAGIHDGWDEAADRAELTAVDRSAFLGRLLLNPGALHGLESLSVQVPGAPAGNRARRGDVGLGMTERGGTAGRLTILPPTPPEIELPDATRDET